MFNSIELPPCHTCLPLALSDGLFKLGEEIASVRICRTVAFVEGVYSTPCLKYTAYVAFFIILNRIIHCNEVFFNGAFNWCSRKRCPACGVLGCATFATCFKKLALIFISGAPLINKWQLVLSSCEIDYRGIYRSGKHGYLGN